MASVFVQWNFSHFPISRQATPPHCLLDGLYMPVFSKLFPDTPSDSWICETSMGFKGQHTCFKNINPATFQQWDTGSSLHLSEPQSCRLKIG